MIKQFDIYVYDKWLNFIGIIDNFSSLRWRRKYFEAGEFELHIPLDSQVQKYFKKDNIIVRGDATEAGVLESLEINDDGEKVDYMITGRFLSSILDRRIVKNKINFKGKILDGEREILSKMTPFSKLVIEDSEITSEDIVFQCTYKNVYTYLIKLSKASGIAHRIIPDIKNKRYIFQNYIGLDRTETQLTNPRYEFSEDKSNIENATYTFSSKDEKNYGLIGGQGVGTDRVLLEINKGNYTDFDLRETFIDAKDISNDGMTTKEYNDALVSRGKEKLINPTESIEVTAYARDYKKSWDLGDIVNIKKESWKVSMKKRIVEIEEVFEPGNYKIYVVFGEPVSEKLQDDE